MTPTTEIAGADTRERLKRMQQALTKMKRVLILPHTDPDPDCIASALGLRRLLAERMGVRSELVYRGIIGRAENKALVRYLGSPLRCLTERDLVPSLPLVLVDTQPGAGNNAAPADHPVAVVLDHHPLRQETAKAAYADVRPVGATSTLVTEYLQAAEIALDPPLATALFYGIKTDTMGLGRGATPADVAAYFYLQPHIDVQALVEIERAQVPADYFRRFVAALQATRIFRDVAITYIGLMSYPDLAAEVADLLLRLEGAVWVLCMGVYEQELILSARTRAPHGNAGQLVQEIVGRDGTSGGHGMLAGGELPLNGQDPARLAEEVRRRALAALGLDPQQEGERLI